MKIIGVVGARLNSTRLPGKQLRDLAGCPLIARIFERLECIPELDTLILATTADSYNRQLVNWARESKKAVFAFHGDVNDLVGRVDAIVQREDADILVYFCGDSPLIEPATVSRMIRVLREHPKAETVMLSPLPEGKQYIHEGFCLYRRSLWNRIVQASVDRHEREHLGVVVEIAGKVEPKNTCYIDEAPLYSHINQRISVDTPSDYRFMREVYRRWYALNPPERIVSLAWVIEECLRDPRLRGMNAQVRQRGVTERSANVLIVTQADKRIGLGHVRRSVVLAEALQDHCSSGVQLLIQGEPMDLHCLELISHRWIRPDDNLVDEIVATVQTQDIQLVVFDINAHHVPADMAGLLATLGEQRTMRVAIDGLWQWNEQFELLHIPGFYVDASLLESIDADTLSYGWDSYLIQPSLVVGRHTRGNKVLVLTGGSDIANLGDTLPIVLDQALAIDAEIHWIQGPYAKTPEIPANPRLQWRLHVAPDDLGHIMDEMDYGLTVYGVTLFELLHRGMPTVTFSPYAGTNSAELSALQQVGITRVARDAPSAVQALDDLMVDEEQASRLASLAAKIIDGRGGERLAKRISARLQRRTQCGYDEHPFRERNSVLGGAQRS